MPGKAKAKKKTLKRFNDSELRKLTGDQFGQVKDKLVGVEHADRSIVIDMPVADEREDIMAIEVPAYELPEEVRNGTRAVTLEDLPNELEFSFSSETREVFRYGDREILSHEKGDADFKRLKNVGSILKNHDGSIVAGVPTKVWLDVEQRKGRLRMRFGTTENALLAKHEVLLDKTVRGVSVGYVVSQWTFLRDEDVEYKGRIKGPAFVATKWSAYEASFTPIAADGSVGIGRNKKVERQSITNKERDTMNEELRLWLEARNIETDDLSEDEIADYQREMDKEDKKAKKGGKKSARKTLAPVSVPEPEVNDGLDENAIREEAATAERERSAGIVGLCKTHKISDDKRDEMITGGTELGAARETILSILGNEDNDDTIGESNRVVTTGLDDRAKRSLATVESLKLRTNTMKREDVKHGGDELPHTSLKEMARDCLQRANITVPNDRSSMITEALRGPPLTADSLRRFMRGEIISTTTSDFPYILAATANKSMLDGFAAPKTTYQLWCKIGSLADFKAMNRIQFSEAGDLQRVYEGGHYEQTALSEDQNPIQVFTYGVKFNISRQAIVNDDLGAFTDIPRKLGRSAARLPNILAVVALSANANLNDGQALFSAAHSNLSSNALFALDTLAHAQNGIKNAIKTLEDQTGMLHAQAAAVTKALTLGLQPQYILTADFDQTFYLRQVINSTSDPTTSNSATENPLQSIATPIQEPLLKDSNITGNSSTAYYGIVDPQDAPVIEVAFLDGVQEPFMEEADQTDADGRTYKVRLDVGAAAVDYRGMFREDGV